MKLSVNTSKEETPPRSAFREWSRAPKNVHNKIHSEIENAVVDIDLSISTIKRVLKRNKLAIQKRERYVGCKSKKRYTLLNPTKVNEIHQIDFVGPRHIKGYGAISSLNLIGVVVRKACSRKFLHRTYLKHKEIL